MSKLYELTRITIENTEALIWVNPEHVITLTEKRGVPQTWLRLVDDTILIKGYARDVALTLNGHFDE